MSVAELDSITGDEMGIHLFDECADNQMARLAMDLLAKENPTMQELKIKVKETENSIWSNNGKNYGKIVAYQKEK